MMVSNRNLLFAGVHFRCYVSFRECKKKNRDSLVSTSFKRTFHLPNINFHGTGGRFSVGRKKKPLECILCQSVLFPEQLLVYILHCIHIYNYYTHIYIYTHMYHITPLIVMQLIIQATMSPATSCWLPPLPIHQVTRSPRQRQQTPLRCEMTIFWFFP